LNKANFIKIGTSSAIEYTREDKTPRSQPNKRAAGKNTLLQKQPVGKNTQKNKLQSTTDSKKKVPNTHHPPHTADSTTITAGDKARDPNTTHRISK
jgi:hypothetical protein